MCVYVCVCTVLYHNSFLPSISKIMHKVELQPKKSLLSMPMAQAMEQRRNCAIEPIFIYLSLFNQPINKAQRTVAKNVGMGFIMRMMFPIFSQNQSYALKKKKITEPWPLFFVFYLTCVFSILILFLSQEGNCYR